MFSHRYFATRLSASLMYLLLVYFHSNDDPTRYYFVEERSPNDPCFHGLAHIYSLYFNDLPVSIMQYLSFLLLKNASDLRLLLFVLIWQETSITDNRIYYQKKPVTTNLSVLRQWAGRHGLSVVFYWKI